MSLHPQQQEMLDHYIQLARTNVSWDTYAREQVRMMAHREPKRWGFLPAALSLALSSGMASTGAGCQNRSGE